MSVPNTCRVYWRSHACSLPRGHVPAGAREGHVCSPGPDPENDCNEVPSPTDRLWGEDTEGENLT